MSERFQTYLFDYDYNGNQWSFEISATSFEDAMARVKVAAHHGHVEGVKYASFPSWFPVRIGLAIAKFNEWRNSRWQP